MRDMKASARATSGRVPFGSWRIDAVPTMLFAERAWRRDWV
jgi:hypothetical protein